MIFSEVRTVIIGVPGSLKKLSDVAPFAHVSSEDVE